MNYIILWCRHRSNFLGGDILDPPKKGNLFTPTSYIDYIGMVFHQYVPSDVNQDELSVQKTCYIHYIGMVSHPNVSLDDNHVYPSLWKPCYIQYIGMVFLQCVFLDV